MEQGSTPTARSPETLTHEFRYLVVSFSSLLYGISNIINLELTNLLCDQDNVKYRLTERDPNSCCYVNRAKLNGNAIDSLELDIYEATFNYVTGWNVFLHSIFFCVNSIDLCWILYQCTIHIMQVNFMVSNDNYDNGDIHSDIDEGYDVTDRSCAKMKDVNDIHLDQSEIKNQYDSTVVSRSNTISDGTVSLTSILVNNDNNDSVVDIVSYDENEILPSLSLGRESQPVHFEKYVFGGKNARIVSARWYLGETIGKGSFGWVNTGYEIYSGQKVALKFVQKKSNVEQDEKYGKQVESEIKVLSQISHVIIVKLLSYSVDCKYSASQQEHEYEDVEKKDNNFTLIFTTLFVFEYDHKGELFDLLYYTKSLEEHICSTYFHQLISGIECLHMHDIIHSDLKPSNLLLDKNVNLKIADLGLCKIFDIENNKKEKNN